MKAYWMRCQRCLFFSINFHQKCFRYFIHDVHEACLACSSETFRTPITNIHMLVLLCISQTTISPPYNKNYCFSVEQKPLAKIVVRFDPWRQRDENHRTRTLDCLNAKVSSIVVTHLLALGGITSEKTNFSKRIFTNWIPNWSYLQSIN